MDLSNYEQIIALIRKLCKGMTQDDVDDIIQDVFLKLVVADRRRKSKLENASKSMVRKIVRQLRIDKQKKRGPSIIYDNDLVEKYHV